MPNPTITSSSYAGEFAGKYIAASLLTAKTLDEAVKFKVALEMLDSGENKSYHILIDTHDAFAYISTEKLEEDKDKVVNIK